MDPPPLGRTISFWSKYGLSYSFHPPFASVCCHLDEYLLDHIVPLFSPNTFTKQPPVHMSHPGRPRLYQYLLLYRRYTIPHMEPFFVVCLQCHNARPWHHRASRECPNGCEVRYSQPWFDGFGPDETPIPRHKSAMYGDDSDKWPDTDIAAIHVNNITEMRELCK